MIREEINDIIERRQSDIEKISDKGVGVCGDKLFGITVCKDTGRLYGKKEVLKSQCLRGRDGVGVGGALGNRGTYNCLFG